ncbi:MAG: hypothetical protein J5852_00290 [Clostridia bacterium]|nr:hypothetical protein [Clostridia bacterium]
MKKVIVLVLCFAFVMTLTSCGRVTTVESKDTDMINVTKIMSHADYMTAAIGSDVTVETYVQAKQSWWEGKATFYTQEPEGAYFIYQMPCTKEEYDALTVGTKIRVSGKKAEWSGEIEITDATFTIIEGNYVAEPVDLTGLLGTDELISHQNELVQFTGMKVEAKTDAAGKKAAYLYNWDGSGKDGDDLYFDASVNGNKFTFTVESYLCGPDTEVYSAVKELKVGDVIDMTGFLYWYEGVNPHIITVTETAAP